MAPHVTLRMVRRSSSLAAFALLLLTAAHPQQAPDMAQMSGKDVWDYAEKLRVGADKHAAMEAFRQLVEKHPDDAVYAPMALYRMTMLAYDAHAIPEAKSYVRAMLDKYPDLPACKMGYGVFYLTAIQLVFENDYQAVIRDAEPHFDRFAPSLNGFSWAASIERVAQAHLKLGKPAAAVETLNKHLPHCLYMLTHKDFYQTMIEAQLAQSDTAGALATARRGFALCAFSTTAVKEMADLVQKAYLAAGAKEKAQQFLAAQGQAGAANPLLEVPVSVPEALATELSQAAGDNPALTNQMLLYIGDSDGALDHARAQVLMATDENRSGAIEEALRTLKAVDLNIARANQLVRYATTGEGDDPLEARFPPLAEAAAAKFRPVVMPGRALTLLNTWSELVKQAKLTETTGGEQAVRDSADRQLLLDALNLAPFGHRVDRVFLPLCDALFAQIGDQWDAYLQFPPSARAKMANYLGRHEHGDQAKALLLSLLPEEQASLPTVSFYVFAEDVGDCGRAGALLSIWALKEGADRRGNEDRAFVCSMIAGHCQAVGDPEVARREVVAYAEDVLSRPGCEKRWSSAVSGLMSGYEQAGEPAKAIERALYWIAEGEKRGVTIGMLDGARFSLACRYIGQGRPADAAGLLREISKHVDANANMAGYAKQQLDELVKAHPELAQ